MYNTNYQNILGCILWKGNIIFPKITNLLHIKENFDVFDFSLINEEIKQINKMEKNKKFLLLF